MIAQAVTELVNKTAHRQSPVLDWHTLFLRRIFDSQINNLSYRVVRREHLAFLNGCPAHAVQRFDSIRGVDGLVDVRRITEEPIQVFLVRTYPAPSESSLLNGLQCAGDGFVVLSENVFKAVTHHVDDAQLDLGLRIDAIYYIQEALQAIHIPSNSFWPSVLIPMARKAALFTAVPF